MIRHMGLRARLGLFFLFILLVGSLAPVAGRATPTASVVMDARTGEVLFARNADTRLHPASLTKMMTLYVAFQAIQRGEVSLDTEITITAEAANEEPTRLGLRTGQTIRLRYLLRAAAVRSANDAATAIGIGISGSQQAYAQRMNATAAAMGMNNTTFRNMHGLTADGHMSTARDMTILGRHLIYDFPQYYNLFSRRTADAGIAQVSNTNARLLDNYNGADGIKTGYTRAAGYNLVSSAQRGEVRIIATYFGGRSTADRYARIVELLDMGFARAPARATVRAPSPPQLASAPQAQQQVTSVQPTASAQIASAPQTDSGNGAARTIRVTGQVATAIRPPSRGAEQGTDPFIEAAIDAAINNTDVEDVLAGILGIEPTAAPAPAAAPAAAVAAAPALPAEPPPPVERIMTAEAIAPTVASITEAEVVERLSTSSGRHWGVSIGRFPNQTAAERALIQVGLSEMSALGDANQRVLQRQGGFDALFLGLTREGAELACRRLQTRGTSCFMLGADQG